MDGDEDERRNRGLSEEKREERGERRGGHETYGAAGVNGRGCCVAPYHSECTSHTTC